VNYLLLSDNLCVLQSVWVKYQVIGSYAGTRAEEEIGHEALKMQGNRAQSLCVLCCSLQEKCFIKKQISTVIYVCIMFLTRRSGNNGFEIL
jgi:hypothetical protein